MRVGVDIRCLQDKFLTGVGEYTWRTLQALKKLKPQLELAGFVNAGKGFNLPAGLPQVMEVARSHWPNKLKNLAFYWGVGKPLDTTLTRSAGQLDACWLPNPNFVHFSGQVPIVITVHDLSFLHFPDFFRRRPRWWYFPAVLKLLKHGLPPQTKVVAVSKYTADDIIYFFPDLKNQLHVIPPGVGPEFKVPPLAAAVTELRNKYKLPAKFILSLGTIEPRKNYRLLLQAYQIILSRYPSYPFDLVIAGGWGWRYGSLQKFYHNLPPLVKARIHWLGYVTETDKPALYNQASVFVYPSFYEGFGIPPLEAMAAGLPVLVSHTSSLSEVVGEAGELISPYQPQLWATMIHNLTTDESMAREFAAKGRRRAEQFTWAKSAQAYYDLFVS